MRMNLPSMALIACILVWLSATVAQSHGSLLWAKNEPNSASLSLSTSKPSYKPNEEILLHIMLTNRSSSSLAVLGLGGIAEVGISVVDSGRHALAENAPEVVGNGLSVGRPINIAPGASFVESQGPNDFEPLSHWGYKLKKPGTYHIVARLRESQVTSNPVTITVTN